MVADPNGKKHVKVRHAVTIYIGSVLGGGILVLPSLAASAAGPSALLAWLIITIISLPIAIMFGGLSSKFPDGGGVSTFAGKAFGRHIGNANGWLYFFLLPVGQPAVMLAGVYYFDYMFGMSREASVLTAYAIITSAVMLALFGRRLTARMQFGIIVAIGVIVLITVVLGVGSIHYEHYTPLFPHGYWAVGEALALILWAYIGIENLSFIAEDFDDPRRDMMKAIIIGTVLTGITYIAVSWVTIGVLTPVEWAAVRAPFAHILNRVSGIGVSYGAVLVSLFIVGASALAFVWGGSNLCQALARQGGLPAFLLRKRGDIPVASILFLWGLYTLSFIVVYVLKIDIVDMAKMVGASTLVTYIVCGLAYFRLMKKGRWAAFITVIGSVVMLSFFGKALIFPVVTILAYFAYILFRERLQLAKKQPVG